MHSSTVARLVLPARGRRLNATLPSGHDRSAFPTLSERGYALAAPTAVEGFDTMSAHDVTMDEAAEKKCLLSQVSGASTDVVDSVSFTWRFGVCWDNAMMFSGKLNVATDNCSNLIFSHKQGWNPWQLTIDTMISIFCFFCTITDL